MDKSELIDKVTHFFTDKPEYDTVLIFGSYASGKFNSLSDVDIAVHTDHRLSLDTLLDLQLDLNLLLHIDIDIVDLRQSCGVFLHEIMTNNIRIRYDEEVYHYYLMESLFFMEYDYPIIKRLQEEKIRRFINEYRNNKQQNGISGEMSQQK